MATELLANPMYILHLTDFHLGKPEITALFTNTKQDELIQRIKEFLDTRGRKHLDILCITGDMMEKNGGTKINFEDVIEFINKLKSQISEINHIYSVPGNHDIDTKKSIEIEVLKNVRKNTILDEKIPNYTIVDTYYSYLSECFTKYEDFVKAIGANKTSGSYPDSEKLRPYIGWDILKLPFNQNIFISWFNTSWLCLQEEQWKHELKSDDDKFTTKTKYFYDHDKISAGDKINEEIYKVANNLKTYDNSEREEEVETLFTLSMCHHFPRLLAWHDQYDYFNTAASLDPAGTSPYHKSFYSHLSKYSLVLNGHTHGQLFDAPFATDSNLDYSNYPAAIMIYEVNFISNFIAHYRIPINVLSGDKPSTLERITAFNENKFLSQLKSIYSYKDLIKDLEWHESCFSIEGNPEMDPIERLNYEMEKTRLNDM